MTAGRAKTDKNDAEMLAELLRLNAIPESYILPKDAFPNDLSEAFSASALKRLSMRRPPTRSSFLSSTISTMFALVTMPLSTTRHQSSPSLSLNLTIVSFTVFESTVFPGNAWWNSGTVGFIVTHSE